jgi:hypothetical protein
MQIIKSEKCEEDIPSELLNKMIRAAREAEQKTMCDICNIPKTKYNDICELETMCEERKW